MNNQQTPLETKVKTKIAQKVFIGVLVLAGLAGVVFLAISYFQPPPPTLTQEQLWANFQSKYGQNWQIELKETTKAPQRLTGGSIDSVQINPNVTQVTKENVDSIARKFLNDNQSLFKVKDSNLKVSQIFDDVVQVDNQRVVTVFYQQSYQNIPVFRSHLNLTFKNNQLVIYDANYYPDLALSTITPQITSNEAFEMAKMAEINQSYPVNQSPFLNQNFAPQIKKEPEKSLSSQPMSKVKSEDLKLEKSSLVIYPRELESKVNYQLAYKLDLGLITQPYLSHPTYYINASDKNQLSLERVEHLHFIIAKPPMSIKGTVTGLEYPYYPPCAFGQSPCTQAGSQINPFQDEKVVANGLSTVTGPTGYYYINVGSDEEIYLTSELNGSYVDVNNRAQPDAKHTYYTTTSVTHSWNWQTGGDSSYKKEESNVFYHVNKIHDYFTQGSPFDITAMNFQVPSYVQEIGGYCPANAWYDDVDFSLHFCGASNPYEATSLGSDVIYHEYTHAVTDKIYTTVFFPYLGITGAMQEGYSDYFAATNVNRSTIGDGIWPEPIRNLHNTKRYPDDLIGEVHEDSLPFSGAMWDLKTSLGTSINDAMIISTEKLQPDSFREFLGYLLILYPSYTTQICDAFYSNHGIYSPFCIHQTTTSPIAYISSPYDRKELSKNPTSLDIIGTAVKSKNGTFQNFRIEYASVNTPNTWVTTGVTLIGNGLNEIMESTLGSIDLTNLYGYYKIKLTVRDTVSEQKYYTSVNIGARTNFPVLPDWPLSPPAVVELDGNIANGLEIIAVSDWATVSVWNQNGNLVWRKPISTFTYSHPAVADINLDGSLEVIILGCSKLDVLDENGSTLTPWPINVPKASVYPDCHRSSPVVANLDGDLSNGLEIIFGADDHKVYAYHYYDGPDADTLPDLVTGWPKETGGRVVATPAVADLDPANNNGLEVVVGSLDNKIYVWRADGSDYRSGIWPKDTGDNCHSSPVIANLDNYLANGLEIVTSCWRKLFAWYADNGNNVFTPITHDHVLFSPIVGNIDNNLTNGLEIAVESRYKADARRSTGTSITGWPQTLSTVNTGWQVYWKEQFDNAPALTDIDGDSRQEIIIANVGDALPILPRIYIFNDDGTLVPGFPLVLNDYYIDNTPALYDLDSNGKFELVFTGSKLHVFDLPWSYSDKKVEAPTFHYNTQRTGFYGLYNCSDGVTPLNQCAIGKPKYCNAKGEFVKNCSRCGCPYCSGCQSDGTCKYCGVNIRKQCLCPPPAAL